MSDQNCPRCNGTRKDPQGELCPRCGGTGRDGPPAPKVTTL